MSNLQTKPQTQPGPYLELEDASLLLSTLLMCTKHPEQGCTIAVLEA